MPICSADGCNETRPCGPYCRDNGNFDKTVTTIVTTTPSHPNAFVNVPIGTTMKATWPRLSDQDTEEQRKRDAEDAARYRWLRDNPRKARSKALPYDAPYVINPRKSVLYAMARYKGEALDEAIDNDRLEDMAQHIFEERQVEGDDRFADPMFWASDEFADECEKKAKEALGWST